MPIQCTFTLNGQKVSTLTCAGFGGVAAFSGNGQHVDDPKDTAVPNKGPDPEGALLHHQAQTRRPPWAST